MPVILSPMGSCAEPESVLCVMVEPSLPRVTVNMPFLHPIDSVLFRIINLIHRSGTRTGLPAASVTLFLANLPFGKQYGDRSTNPQFYRELLVEMSRLGAPGRGRAVLLSSDMDALDGALAEVPSFTVERRLAVATGAKAAVMVLHPSAHA